VSATIKEPCRGKSQDHVEKLRILNLLGATRATPFAVFEMVVKKEPRGRDVQVASCAARGVLPCLVSQNPAPHEASLSARADTLDADRRDHQERRRKAA
jgi:hypothetical protein